MMVPENFMLQRLPKSVGIVQLMNLGTILERWWDISMFCIDVEVSLSLVELCIELNVGCRKKSGNVWTVYDYDLENIKNFMLHYLR